MTTTPPPDDPHGRLTAPAPPTGALDAARAAALDAFDEVHGTRDEGGAAPVRDLSSARSRPWYERVPLGAVAAVLAVIALVGAFTQVDLGTDDEDTAATAVSDEATAEDSGGSSAGDDGESGDDSGGDRAATGSASAEQSEAPTAAFGAERQTYGDVDALVEDLAGRYSRPDGSGGVAATTSPSSNEAETTASDAASGLDGCGYLDVAGVEVDDLVAVESVVVAGDDAVAVVYDSATGLRVAVVDSACSLVADRPL